MDTASRFTRGSDAMKDFEAIDSANKDIEAVQIQVTNKVLPPFNAGQQNLNQVPMSADDRTMYK